MNRRDFLKRTAQTAAAATAATPAIAAAQQPRGLLLSADPHYPGYCPLAKLPSVRVTVDGEPFACVWLDQDRGRAFGHPWREFKTAGGCCSVLNLDALITGDVQVQVDGVPAAEWLDRLSAPERAYWLGTI